MVEEVVDFEGIFIFLVFTVGIKFKIKIWS